MTHRQARFLFGSLLLAFLVAIGWLDHARGTAIATPWFAALLGCVGLIEFRRMAGDRLPRHVGSALVLGGGAVLLLTVLASDRGSQSHRGSQTLFLMLAVGPVLAVLAPCLSLMRLRWRSGVQRGDLDVAGIVAIGVFVTVVPVAALIATVHLPSGVLFGVVVVLGCKLNDIGGYLIGSAMGKRKLCPGISPNKTWEGSVGGFALGVAGTFLMCLLLPGVSDRVEWWQSVLLGIALAITTQAGDLFESLLKRAAGVKDSGALIPAFGGVLDLVDSLIFAAPVGYAMGLAWLV
ncbi:MAG: hypothetical protein CMJ83_04465 [Planctomycetes bacterium]|nr:hypothetical protein [Planctomycetota bacterium]